MKLTCHPFEVGIRSIVGTPAKRKEASAIDSWVVPQWPDLLWYWLMINRYQSSPTWLQ